MKLKRSLKNDKFAVSVVIGVVLLIVVSVSLSGAVLAYVTNITNGKKSVVDGLKNDGVVGVASNLEGTGLLQLVPPDEADPDEDEGYTFIVEKPDGDTNVISPEEFDMSTEDINDGKEIYINRMVGVGDGDPPDGEYKITVIKIKGEDIKHREVCEFTFDLTFNKVPVVGDISGQNIAEGDTFDTINLDDYVTDAEDPDSAIGWTYSGNVELIVDITNRIATISTPNPDWNGEETITFTATDSGGLTDSYDATFTVTPVNDPPDAPNNLNPANGAFGISIRSHLSWSEVDDPDGDSVAYDVYFGTTSTLPLVSSEQNPTSYGPGAMSYSTTYYWKIISKDSHGASTEGEMWSFTTKVKAQSVCLLAGTKVSMADGNNKNIEDIEVGDLVIANDLTTGELMPASVIKLYHHTPSEMTDYYLIINDDLKVTPNHPMYINGKWQHIGDAKVGDVLLGMDGSDVIITSMEVVFEKVPTYNLEVEEYHTYFANGVLVHNRKIIRTI